MGAMKMNSENHKYTKLKTVAPDDKAESFKNTRIDRTISSLIFTFLVSCLKILFTCMTIYFYLCFMSHAKHHGACSIIRANDSVLGKIDCSTLPNHGYYTFITVMRAITGVFGSIFLFCIMTQVGTKCFGYRNIGDCLTTKHIANFLYFYGKYGNLFIEFTFVSNIMQAILFYDEIDDSLKEININNVFADNTLVTVTVVVYFALRIAYLFSRKCPNVTDFVEFDEKSNDVRDGNTSTRKENSLIYKNSATSPSNSAICAPLNVALGVAICVALLLQMVYALVNLAENDGFGDRLGVVIFVFSLFALNSIKHVIFAVFLFKNTECKVNNVTVAILLFLGDSSLSLFYTNDSGFYQILFWVGISTSLLVVLLGVLNIALVRAEEDGKSLKTYLNEHLTEENTVKVLNFVLTAAICISLFFAFFVLLSNAASEPGEALGYKLQWCNELAGNATAKSAMMAFRPSESFLAWTRVLVVFLNLDCLAIFFVLFLLVLFPRSLPSKPLVLLAAWGLLLYSAYASVREDAFFDEFYGAVSLGVAEAQPQTSFLHGLSYANKLSTAALCYFLVLLAFVEGEGSPKPRGSGPDRGTIPADTRVTAVNVIVAMSLFVIYFLVMEASHYKWIELAVKGYGESDFLPGAELPFNATAVCANDVSAANAQLLSSKLISFGNKMNSFHNSTVDVVVHEFFDSSFDRWPFLFPIFLSTSYLFLCAFVNFSFAYHVAIHVGLIISVLLDYIIVNTLYVLISNFTKGFPGTKYLLKADKGLESFDSACLFALAILAVSLISLVAPIQVPERTQEETRLDY